MPSLLFWLAVATLALWALSAVDMVLGNRRIRFLREVAPVDASAAPRVSVVIAARDEARNIEAALASVLCQRYPALEVLVVDDRSTDATGVILDRMELEHRALRVVHVEELPPGWLGKNHALHLGAEAATGELLLFTDADVVLEPTTVARAVELLRSQRLDHLAVAPELTMPGPALDLFAGAFAIFFAQYARPWKARDPQSGRHVGIGAFNLVRRDAYRAVGGHAPIAMRPDDDLKLGKLLKQAGFHQDVAFGRGLVAVEWYASLGEAVRGLEKNSFAGVGYSVAAVAGAVVAMLAFNVWPFVAVWVTGGAVWGLNAATVLIVLLLYAGSTRASGSRWWLGIGFPVATLFFLYIVVRSAWLALRNDGIDWRGTHYPLAALRANRV